MDRQELVIEDDSSVDSDSPKAAHPPTSPTSTQFLPPNPLPKPLFPIAAPNERPTAEAPPRLLVAAAQTSHSSTRPVKQLLPRIQRKQLRPLPLTTRRRLRPSLSLEAEWSRGEAEQSMLRKQFQTSFPCRESGIPAYDARQDKHLKGWRTRKQANSASNRYVMRVKRGETDSERVKLPPIRQKSTPGIVRESYEKNSRCKKAVKNSPNKDQSY